MKKILFSLIIAVALVASTSVLAQDNTKKEGCEAKTEKCEKKTAATTETKSACCAEKKTASAEAKSCGKK
jgi:Ni/Co efflux regulator RcnB